MITYINVLTQSLHYINQRFDLFIPGNIGVGFQALDEILRKTTFLSRGQKRETLLHTQVL